MQSVHKKNIYIYIAILKICQFPSKDRTKYRVVLENNMLEDAKDVRLKLRFTFLQDDNPKHKARDSLAQLKSKSESN